MLHFSKTFSAFTRTTTVLKRSSPLFGVAGFRQPFTFYSLAAKDQRNRSIETLEYHEKHKADVIDLIVNDFRRNEPLGMCLKLKDEDTEALYEDYANIKLENDGFSMVAVSEDNVVGHVRISHIAEGDQNQHHFVSKIRRLESLFHLFDVLLEGAWAKGGCLAEAKKVGRLELLSVASGYGGSGIAKHITRQCVEKAKELGYDCVIVLCTNPITVHLCKDKFGFTVEKALEFKSFNFDGETPFSGISEDNSHGKLMVKMFE